MGCWNEYSEHEFLLGSTYLKEVEGLSLTELNLISTVPSSSSIMSEISVLSMSLGVEGSLF